MVHSWHNRLVSRGPESTAADVSCRLLEARPATGKATPKTARMTAARTGPHSERKVRHAGWRQGARAA